jgi:ubiquinol-cytochrome c reductase cytochrome c1 subunit
MIRIGAFLVGLFFAGWLLVSALLSGYSMVTDPAVPTAEHEFHKAPKHVSFAHDGPMGKFDRAQLQRGFQVYKEVCSACHSLRLVSFRDLEGIGYNEGQIKTLANEWQIEVPSINPETGETATRKAQPSDRFPLVYANETAGRAANNNALPPDLSLITKARHEGPAYVYSLLTGFQAPPAKLAKEFPDSMPGKTTHYNPYFANLNLAMAAPLTAEGQVQYAAGGPKPTVDQMSKDVAAFLTWAAEPKMEIRKQVGMVAVVFLLIFGWLCWQAYQNVWSDKKRIAA